MSTKRQPSKQRRQSQNKNNRAALEKRRQNIEAGKVPAGKVGGEAAPPAKTSVLSRLTGSNRSSTSSTSTSGARTGTTAAAKPGAKQYPTGYRAVLTALFLAFIGVVFTATLKAPVDHSGEMMRTRDDKTADWAWAAGDEAVQQPEATPEALAQDVDWTPGGTEPYLKAGLPYSVAVVLPLAAAGLAFWVVRKGGATSKVLNRCMYVSLFGALLNTQLAIMFLPAAIAIGVAGYQIRKEEMANAPAPDEAPARGRAEVIDVDEVDDEPLEPVVIEAAEAAEADDDLTEASEVAAVTEPVEVEPEPEPEREPEPEVTAPAAPKRRAGGGLQLTNRADDD